MIDPTDVNSGDVLAVGMMTVYQDIDSDPYEFEMTVHNVEQTVDDDDGTVIVDIYRDYKRDQNDGYATRRIRFRGANPEYQQARGDPADPTWAKYSRDDFCNVREADTDEDDEDEVKAEETETEADADVDVDAVEA